MKKINWKMLIITTIVSLLPIGIGLVFYDKLPNDVAIHFDINNNPDNYFPKLAFVFGMPIMMALLQVFCCVVNDISDKNEEANQKMVTVSKWIIPIISIILYVVTVSFALGNNIDIRKIVMLILGVMFIVMGNYLPKTKGNNYLKVRIQDERLENRVKRIFGYIFILNGILFMVSILLEAIVSVVLVGVIILEALVLSIYAFVKNRD